MKIIYRNGAILMQCEQGVDEIAAFVKYPKNRCIIILLQKFKTKLTTGNVRRIFFTTLITEDKELHSKLVFRWVEHIKLKGIQSDIKK